MGFPRKLSELCSPAYVYFLLSFFGIVLLWFQNMSSSNRMYMVGSYRSNVVNKIVIFAVKIIYILFWTWILNLMCKDGHKDIAWILVLLPFVLMFLMVISTMTSYGGMGLFEGLESKDAKKKQMLKK
jgi:hypothetical protein